MKELTREDRIALHKEFLSTNWSLLASFSWTHYLEKGAGAVVVPEEDIVSTEAPKLLPVRMRFLPAGSNEMSEFDCWGEKERGWVRDYDPQQRVIVIVLRNGGVSSYLAGGHPLPPEAYAKTKAGQN